MNDRGTGTFLPNGAGTCIVSMTLPNKFDSELDDAADAVTKSMQSVTAQESARTVETGEAAIISNEHFVQCSRMQ